MGSNFKKYAKIYDIIYRNKDYCGECDFLLKIFKRFLKSDGKDILDLSSGTGGHIIPLAKLGYNIFAQDASLDMLKIAKNKAKDYKNIKFIGCYPMQRFNHNQKFDIVITMFSSIDYVTRIKDLIRTLANVKKCLKPNGLFIFDFWNKQCVERSYSADKRNEYSSGQDKVVRISKTSLEKLKSIAKIRYTCQYFHKDKPLDSFQEIHRMRYHNISTMQSYLKSAGFEVLGCFPFGQMNSKIDLVKDWNISIVAKIKN